MEELLKAIPVFLGSMVKFILGPTIGFAAKLHFLTTVFVTIAGMMTSVTLFTFFGEWIRKRFFKNKMPLSTNNPKHQGIWKKYGLAGIAFFTPVVLTPIGGTLLAVSSGSPKEKIIFFMFVSAAIWSLIFTGVIYFVGSQVLPEFVK